MEPLILPSNQRPATMSRDGAGRRSMMSTLTFSNYVGDIRQQRQQQSLPPDTDTTQARLRTH